jgi:RND family efflux transporter MFP subunit
MRTKTKVVLVVCLLAFIAGGVALSQWNTSRSAAESPANGTPGKAAGGAPVSVTTTMVKKQDLPVTVSANGTVVALQVVDVRAQVNSTVTAIHFKEGQTVAKGAPLFTLDGRGEAAAQTRAEAQITKSRSDYANAERNLKRQRELFEQKFISQAALDTAINQVELLRGQLAVDQASGDVTRVAKSLTEIRAPFSGRTGAISVRVGSLTQPAGSPMVTISQIDPIAVSFALPERELAYVQQSFAKGDVPISIDASATRPQAVVGKLSFIESTIDTASGTIPMKATFANSNLSLWPGMFVSVSVPTRVIADASVVPVQAVQTGPERKFVYAVSGDNIATIQPVEVTLIQGGFAAVTGVAPGTRVVVEGAQNVRPKGPVKEEGKPSKSEVTTDAKATAPEKTDPSSPAKTK